MKKHRDYNLGTTDSHRWFEQANEYAELAGGKWYLMTIDFGDVSYSYVLVMDSEMEDQETGRIGGARRTRGAQ